MPVPQLFEHLGVTVPIFQAPIGSIASVELAAAISEAGGLGNLACTWRSPDQLRDLFGAVQRLTKRPFGANFVVDFPIDERLGVALEHGVRVISFFWGDGSPHLGRVKARGAVAIQVVGSIDEATASADMVCANLTADVILELLPTLIRLTCGRLILSGILDTQVESIEARLREVGITSDYEITQDGEWACFVV